MLKDEAGVSIKGGSSAEMLDFDLPSLSLR